MRPREHSTKNRDRRLQQKCMHASATRENRNNYDCYCRPSSSAQESLYNSFRAKIRGPRACEPGQLAMAIPVPLVGVFGARSACGDPQLHFGGLRLHHIAQGFAPRSKGIVALHHRLPVQKHHRPPGPRGPVACLLGGAIRSQMTRKATAIAGLTLGPVLDRLAQHGILARQSILWSSLQNHLAHHECFESHGSLVCRFP